MIFIRKGISERKYMILWHNNYSSAFNQTYNSFLVFYLSSLISSTYFVISIIKYYIHIILQYISKMESFCINGNHLLFPLCNFNLFRLYHFPFHKPIRSRLVKRRLYLPFTTYKSTAESATLRHLNSGLHQFTEQCL